MIDIDKLKELVGLMVENDLSELDLQDQHETVTIKRGAQPIGPAMNAAPAGYGAQSQPSGGATAAAGGGGGGAPVAADAGLVAITSPMVGTFYTSPNPDSAPFVSVGTAVGPDTTVCLIEAMKVFNEIKAECSGVIERVLVEKAKPVEYGQKLFLVRPN